MAMLSSEVLNLQIALRETLIDNKQYLNIDDMSDVYYMGINLINDIRDKINSLDSEYHNIQYGIRDSDNQPKDMYLIRVNREVRENTKKNLILANKIVSEFVRMSLVLLNNIVEGKEKDIKKRQDRIAINSISSPSELKQVFSQQTHNKQLLESINEHALIVEERKRLDKIKEFKDVLEISPFSVGEVKILNKNLHQEIEKE